MTHPKITFAIPDLTSYRFVKPIAKGLSKQDINVGFLLFDNFFSNSKRNIKNLEGMIDFETVSSRKYIPHTIFETAPNSWSAPRAALQRILTDNISHQVAYNTKDWVADSDCDVFVATVDQFPFIRHIIKEAANYGITTIVLQHGTYAYALDQRKLSNGFLFPNITEEPGPLEQIKRRLGFRYGLTQYCHPYVDFVCTLGDFFTDLISEYRDFYQKPTDTQIISTGSTEYDADIEEYDPTVDSALYLSQQKLEAGVWQWEEEEEIIDMLRSFSVPVTIRPHPKDSPSKISAYRDYFDISETEEIVSDINNYDAVVTFDSTAIYGAVIRGKVCGSIQLSTVSNGFEPYTHDHIVPIKEGVSIAEAATDRSQQTQREYLNKFCHMPQLDDEADANSSTELLTTRIRDVLTET